MRIIATSDLHGDLPDPDSYPNCDVFIIAGDVCPRTNYNLIFQRSWLESNFTQWLQALPAEHIIGIGGNHDFALERHETLARKLPWNYLLDESIKINGLKFWGTPWLPNLSLWAFHQLDHVLDEKFALIPRNTDVVIGHAPPLMHCDRTAPKNGDVHAGAPSLIPMLARVEPMAYICGHIHEGYGYDGFLETTVLNVAHMTENYEPINDHAVLDFLEPDHGMFFHDLLPTRTEAEANEEFWKAAY